MNPDRILVGECRGPETMAMLWSFATGHAGMTSVHGESAEHALQNLVRFALTSGFRIEAEQALEWVRDVDLVVHCDRPRSRGRERLFLPRQIDEIVEVAGIEGRRLTRIRCSREPALSALARERASLSGRTRAGRLPCRMMMRLGPVLIAFLVAVVGCDGGNEESATQPSPPATTQEDREATLERTVRSALTANRRLSVYVLWNNRIPAWAGRSTRGPALEGSGPRRRIARGGESGCGCSPIGSRSSRSPSIRPTRKQRRSRADGSAFGHTG